MKGGKSQPSCHSMGMLNSFQTKKQYKMKSLYMDGLGIQGDHTHFVTIKLPNFWVVKLMAQAIVLSLVIVSFPWINTIIRGITSSYGYNYVSKVDEMTYNNPIKLELLPIIFHDLTNEGLLKIGDRSLLIINGINEEAIYNTQVITNDYNMELISFSNLAQQQSPILEETFDFIMLPYGFSNSLNFIDRILKVGGIIVVQNDKYPIDKFPQPSNYKVVYVRKFDSTIIVMRKTTSFVSTKSTSHHRKLFNFGPNTKEDALKKLEDVLLEPPRASSGKSKGYLQKTRYLPDLMNIPLKDYPRRVFIDVGLQDKNEAPGDSSWFSKNYPTRNTKFEIFKIETVTNNNKESLEDDETTPMLVGMSDWLKKNVKEDEYIVMKAEAEVVEEMVKNKATRLVDELFLECKHKGDKKSKRAYWECLSLYGMLRDEGVAVHQWWG